MKKSCKYVFFLISAALGFGCSPDKTPFSLKFNQTAPYDYYEGCRVADQMTEKAWKGNILYILNFIILV